MKENIAKVSEKSLVRLEKAINLKTKQIAKKNIDIDTRVECLAKTPAFISLKGHKLNFMPSYPCRLMFNQPM